MVAVSRRRAVAYRRWFGEWLSHVQQLAQPNRPFHVQNPMTVVISTRVSWSGLNWTPAVVFATLERTSFGVLLALCCRWPGRTGKRFGVGWCH